MYFIPRDELRAGDALVRPGHVELFSHWVDELRHSEGAFVYSLNAFGESVQNPYVPSNFNNLGKNSDNDMA